MWHSIFYMVRTASTLLRNDTFAIEWDQKSDSKNWCCLLCIAIVVCRFLVAVAIAAASKCSSSFNPSLKKFSFTKEVKRVEMCFFVFSNAFESVFSAHNDNKNHSVNFCVFDVPAYLRNIYMYVSIDKVYIQYPIYIYFMFALCYLRSLYLHLIQSFNVFVRIWNYWVHIERNLHLIVLSEFVRKNISVCCCQFVFLRL